MPEEITERARSKPVQKWNLESLNINDEGKVVRRPRSAIRDAAQDDSAEAERSTTRRRPDKDPWHRRKPVGLGDENFRPMVSPFLYEDAGTPPS